MLHFKKILCPTDFSEPAQCAWRTALALASQGQSEICLLHVVPRDELAHDELAPGQADPTQAQRYLESQIRDDAPPSLQVRAAVRRGDATTEILRAAQDEEIDLIVMATHGATGWREFVLGSVMDEVVRLAPCPVLTISSAARQKPDTGAETAVPSYTAANSQTTAFGSSVLSPPESSGEEYSGEEYSGDGDFPFDGSPEAKLRFLLSYAILAPSNRNTQPWRWRICEDTIELYADRGRALPHLDPDDRELIMSCGAALLHLRVAMRHFGHEDEVELLPDRDDPDLLAVVRLGGEYSASADDERLFAAIPIRHTNRHPFLERELSTALKADLQSAAEQEGASLLLIEENEARMAIINLISRSDREQGRDPQFLQETAGWIRPNRSPSDDGIPQHAWGGGGMVSRYATDSGAAMSDKDRLLAWSAPLMAVLETGDDTPHDWMTAGQALARVLLRAAAEGVQASFFNSPVEVVAMWPQLHHILGCAGLPQMILRLGYPALETGATPRRVVSEVLTGAASRATVQRIRPAV